jgi:hypothetical protein
MKSNLRERVYRIIMASLLQSDLTSEEILIIGKAFSQETEFSWELGSLLKNISNRLDPELLNKMSPNDKNEDLAEDLFLAMKIVKAKRLSKTKILEYIAELSPSDDLSPYNSSTVRDLLTDFFINKSNIEKNNLLKLLETGGKNEDEYLRGMIRRGNY